LAGAGQASPDRRFAYRRIGAGLASSTSKARAARFFRIPFNFNLTFPFFLLARGVKGFRLIR
jgi:hypothetical protein